MDEIKTELFEKLSKLQWLMHRLQLKKSSENGPMADKTRGQGRILALLKLQDGISTKDLSYLLGIRVSSLNELLAKMEKTGYITREPSETDRRIMLVKLTEKGKEENQQEWNPGDIFSCLSGEEQISFGKNLDLVIAAVEAEAGVEVSDEERNWWLGGGRERMGDEQFERFASMRRHGFAPREGFDPRRGFAPGEETDPRRRFGGPRGGMGRPGTPPPHRESDESGE